LLAHLIKEPKFRAILDVWANEPDIAKPLLRKVAIGTPHIAGYSYDGKVAGTKMVYEALCEYLQVPPVREVRAPKLSADHRTLNWSGSRSADCFGYLRQCLDIKADDKRLRVAAANSAKVGPAFDHLRKAYPQRREFSQYQLPKQLQGELYEQLVALGFRS
jgi:erythronate-4-phosphate dehydrogenase